MIDSLILALALTQTPEPIKLAVIQDDVVTMTAERDLQIEHQRLRAGKILTFGQNKRLAAIVATLGTVPYRCTKGQAYAGLCVRVEDLKR